MHTSVVGSAHQDNPQSIDLGDLKRRSKARLRFELDEDLCGLPKKNIAILLAFAPEQLSRCLGENYPDDLPAHKVPAVTRKIGPGYMEWLAEECGGVYHHGERPPHSHTSVTTLIGLLAKQGGSVVAQLLQHLNDHIWTLDERHQDVSGLRKLQSIVETLIRDAEGGGQ